MSIRARLAGAVLGAVGLAEAVAPRWALGRDLARGRREVLARLGVSGGYSTAGNGQGYGRHGASSSKRALQGWLSSSGGPDTDIGGNLDRLRERSRDLFMGAPLATGALKTIRTNVVGPGLRLNAEIDAEYLGLDEETALAWEDRTEREFGLWADSTSCDAERRHTFGELQSLALFSELLSGDVFVLLPAIPRPGERYDLRVKLVEADRVSEPTLGDLTIDRSNGIELGPHGEPVAYHVARYHPGDALPVGKQQVWDRVPAFGAETGRPLVLHLMESERPGQRRGVPLLAPVVETLKQLTRYTDAELTAAVVSGMFTAAITSQAPQNALGPVVPATEQVAAGDDMAYELGNGALLSLAPGERLEAVNPARPNAGFDPFVIALCRQIGAALELPYELLVKAFTASYSASRAALLEAWKTFIVWRSRMAEKFCRPIYEQWLEEAVLRGYVSAPGFFADPLVRAAWCGAQWHGPTPGQLDPVKEVQAADLRVAGGYSTRARETTELTGGNWDRNHRVRVREERLRRDGGLIQAPATPAPAKQATAAPAVEEQAA